MPISHKYKCIFIHIPKCAGTSIEQALDMFDNNELFGYDKVAKLAKQHATAIQTLNYIDKNIFADYFKFAFVRNPYDRAVSSAAYHNIGLLPFLQNKKYSELRHGIPFNQHLVQHLKPQNEYTTNLDFIGKYENLAADWEYVNNRLRTSIKLNHTNTSVHNKYTHYYDCKSISIVNELYKDDFEIFNYKKIKPIRYL